MTYVNIYIDPARIHPRLVGAQNVYDIVAHLFPAVPLPAHRVSHIELEPAALNEMEHITESMHRELREKKNRYEVAVEGYMRVIFTNILRALVHASDRSTGKGRISELLEYIEKNYTRRITLVELANRFYYNSVYLGKLFHQTFQVPFKDYVCEKRLRYAEKLLLETDMTIDAIAAAAGFSDKKFFYKVFKGKHNRTPMQYRKTET